MLDRAAPGHPVLLHRWWVTGIPLAYGSDGLRNPFYNMIVAITGGTKPTEALSREDAVTMYTRGAAYAEFGRLGEGYVISSLDPRRRTVRHASCGIHTARASLGRPERRRAPPRYRAEHGCCHRLRAMRI